MQQLIKLCVIFIAIRWSFAQVVLQNGVAEKVVVDKSEFEIHIDNTLGNDGEFKICVGATAAAVSDVCPAGYALIRVFLGEYPKKKKVTLNREGHVLRHGDIEDKIKIRIDDDDDTLDLKVVALPDPATVVTLVGVSKWVPTTIPTTTTTEIPSTAEGISQAGVIGISLGAAAGVVLVIVVVVIIILCCCRRKKKSNEPVPPPAAVVTKTPGTAGQGDQTQPTGDKKTLTKSPTHKKSKKPDGTSPPARTPSAEPSKTSGEKAPEPSAEKGHHPVDPKTPPSKGVKHRLPVSPKADKSQSDKHSFKKSDIIKADDQQCEILSEPIIAYGLRSGKISLGKYSKLRRTFKSMPHEVSPMEKDILKAAPTVAVNAADALVTYVDGELDTLGFNPETGFDQPPRFWEHLNNPQTMTSMLYCMLIRIDPKLFTVEQQSIHDRDVEKMPVSMLYAMVLNKKLKTRFREDLVIFMRKRALEVIEQVPRNSLRKSAFPLHYLVLLQQKMPERFIEGKK